jgi:hypothetical protein
MCSKPVSARGTASRAEPAIGLPSGFGAVGVLPDLERIV